MRCRLLSQLRYHMYWDLILGPKCQAMRSFDSFASSYVFSQLLHFFPAAMHQICNRMSVSPRDLTTSIQMVGPKLESSLLPSCLQDRGAACDVDCLLWWSCDSSSQICPCQPPALKKPTTFWSFLALFLVGSCICWFIVGRLVLVPPEHACEFCVLLSMHNGFWHFGFLSTFIHRLPGLVLLKDAYRSHVLLFMQQNGLGFWFS